MLKRLSNADDEQLHYYLARIREIAALGDEAALLETDKLIWEIAERNEQGWNDPQAAQDALVHSWNANYDDMVTGTGAYEGSREIRRQNATERLERFRRKVDSKTVTFFDINSFRQEVKYRGSLFPHGPQVEDEELHRIIAECVVLADKAEPVAMERSLEDCLTSPFSNINSVLSMVYRLDQTITGYTQGHELTEGDGQRVRRAKERGARFRAGKKSASAKVAAAAGHHVSAASLRKEATALLAQDWAMIFDGEAPPQHDLETI